MKRLCAILVLLAAATTLVVAQGKIKNPDTLIMAANGDVATFDPAVAYDNVSWSMISLIYDRLVDFEGADLGKFKPEIASEVPTVANGGISKDGMTYTFKIKTGLKFSNGYPVTANDVAYSFRRNMVTDPDAGPDWIWYQVFLAGTGSRGDDGKIAVDYKDIANAIQVKGNTVVFKLAKPFPAFLGVLAGKWASIISQKWVTEQGGWDGTEATWQQFNNPATGKETLFDKAMGTGPYSFVRWDKGVEADLTRNDLYWGKKPSIKNGVYKVVDEQATRKLMLVQGDADIIYVPATNFPEMANEKGIKIYKNLPSLDISGAHFNMKINDQSNPNIYSGKLDGEGIPSDFFSDINVRLGFIYAWDEKTEIRDGFNGNCLDPVTPFPRGLPFKNGKLESKPHDMAKAAEYFKKAWGGQLWEKGFKFDILFNSGNLERETAAKIIAENVGAINPKFQIGVRGVEWPVFLDARKNKTMPIYMLGWSPDYPDADDYALPYMHSTGDFASRQGYNNPKADELVKAAGIELDPAKRQAAYYKLQDIWLQDAIAIVFSQPLRQRFMKDWVKGYYYTPMETQEIDLLPILQKSY
jgi:peptide/nickel transport system substrate-binding protein